MLTAILLTLGVVTWSAIANLHLGDRAYLARNLVLAAALVTGAAWGGLAPAELGLGVAAIADGLVWGGAAVSVVVTAVVTGATLGRAWRPLGRLLDDRRADLDPAQRRRVVLVRIPFGTALFEELLFRGVVLAVLLQVLPTVPAVAWSSAAFGLWHVAPTLVALRENGRDRGLRGNLGAIGSAVVVTALAGIGFVALRLGSGSLLAPVLAHWATNAAGLLAAARYQAAGRGARSATARPVADRIVGGSPQ